MADDGLGNFFSDMLGQMTPEQWAAMSNPGVPWQGGEKIVQGVAQGVADIPRRFITEAGAYQPGVRREDYTDIPATGGFGSFGSQPNDAPVAASTDTAAALMGGGTAFAKPGTAGIFGGRLAKTADQAALTKAEEMTAQAAHPDDIFKQTGWFKGADDKWRFEIPDQTSRFTGNPVTESLMRYDKPTTMGEAFSHPDLYAAYPQLQQTEFGVKYNPAYKGTYQPPVFGDPPSITLSNMLNLGEMRSTNLHELQHAVQDIEGFAKGGNTYGLKPGTPAWDIYQERLKAMTTPLDRDTFGKVAGYEGGVVPDGDWEKYLKVIKNPKNFADRAAQEYGIENAYRRQAGEVEARNVQTRLNRDPAVMKETPPSATQDVPTENQFVTFRNPNAPLSEQMQGAARDPALWHPISAVKLSKPVSEMTSTHVPTGPPIAEKTITPSDLQGGLLLPLWGDRSAAGSMLTHVGDTPLPKPQPMYGGHGFMERTSPQGGVWANEQGPATQLANIASAATEKTGKPVYGSYTAMSPTSVDFASHMWEPAAGLLQNAPMGRKDLAAFNRAMKEGYLPIKDFPGATSNNLAEYLAEASGPARNKFIQTLDSRRFQAVGAPDIGQLRAAVTDPRLLNVPTGSGGLSISRIDPAGRTFPGQHPDFPVNVAGTYTGTLGQQVPMHIIYPDIVKAVEAIRAKMPGYAPPVESMVRTRTRGAPVVQPANQRWVDRMSNWLEQNQGGR